LLRNAEKVNPRRKLFVFYLFYRRMHIYVKEPNTQNTRYSSQENPCVNLTTRTQYPQKINVWAGIFNNQIIRPFETVGNLNSQTCLDIKFAHQEVWFQQNCCPMHCGVNVRTHLHQAFPNHWIGRGDMYHKLTGQIS
jgi:hypothetical protein